MAGSKHLPAEWAPQSAVQLTWPHDRGDWEDNLLPAHACFAAIATALSSDTTVLIVARDKHEREAISRELAEAGARLDRCRFAIAPSDDSWARDHSPLTVIGDDGPELLKFEFNGWGGRYRAEQDNHLSLALHDQGIFGDTPMTEVGLVLEGGAVETDGTGRFLLRESCVVDGKRNPGLDRTAMESVFRRWLGAERIDWLAHGDLEGDDTDGHIDTLARFAPDGRILHQACDDSNDSHFQPLADMTADLQSLVDDPRALAPLPLPRAQHDSQGRRMPAGYANFLITDTAVLVPVYDDPADNIALERIGRCFPGRRVTGIDCRALVRQGGSLHCVTMQYPAGVIRPDAGLPAVNNL